MNLRDTLVVLDTCVLLKARVSDVIMDLRAEGLFSAHWTENIDEEFLRNMQLAFKVSEAGAHRRLTAIKARCPEWEVFMTSADFSAVPKQVDQKDRHVAAAAIALRHAADKDREDEADQSYDVILVTDNVKDFAKKQMYERCPHCWRAIDPLGPDAWKCSACHRMFAPEPQDWLRDFKQGPGHSGSLVQDLLKPDWFECESGPDANSWLCHRGGDDFTALEGEQLAHGFLYEHQHARVAFEEACTLWDTVLAQHRECALEEPMPRGGGKLSLVEFKCPVAAAAIAAFGWLGVRSQLLGEWQLWHSQQLGVDYVALGRSPAHLRKALIRDLARVALFDALRIFGRVARAGRWRTKWDGPISAAGATASVNTLQGVRHLKATVSFSDLLKAVDVAGEGCVRFQKHCLSP